MKTREQEVLLIDSEVAAILKLSKNTLANLRSQGKGPSFVRLGRTVRYLESDIYDYIESGRVRTEDTGFCP